MAISATQIATSNTLENFRQQFNNLQTDVNGLENTANELDQKEILSLTKHQI